MIAFGFGFESAAAAVTVNPQYKLHLLGMDAVVSAVAVHLSSLRRFPCCLRIHHEAYLCAVS